MRKRRKVKRNILKELLNMQGYLKKTLQFDSSFIAITYRLKYGFYFYIKTLLFVLLFTKRCVTLQRQLQKVTIKDRLVIIVKLVNITRFVG